MAHRNRQVEPADMLLAIAASATHSCCIFLFLLSMLDLPGTLVLTADWQGAVLGRREGLTCVEGLGFSLQFECKARGCKCLGCRC